MLTEIEEDDGTIRTINLVEADGFSVGLAKPGIVRFALTHGDEAIAVFLTAEDASCICSTITDAFVGGGDNHVSRH